MNTGPAVILEPDGLFVVTEQASRAETVDFGTSGFSAQPVEPVAFAASIVGAQATGGADRRMVEVGLEPGSPARAGRLSRGLEVSPRPRPAHSSPLPHFVRKERER